MIGGKTRTAWAGFLGVSLAAGVIGCKPDLDVGALEGNEPTTVGDNPPSNDDPEPPAPEAGVGDEITTDDSAPAATQTSSVGPMPTGADASDGSDSESQGETTLEAGSPAPSPTTTGSMAPLDDETGASDPSDDEASADDEPTETFDDPSSDTGEVLPTDETSDAASETSEPSDVTDSDEPTSDVATSATDTETDSTEDTPTDPTDEPTDPPAEPLNVTELSPLQDATDADPGTNLVITFDAAVSLGTGELEIVDLDNDRSVETIAVSDARVSLTADGASIDLDSILAGSTAYSVTVPAGAFEGSEGEVFDGITWTFQTAAVSPPGGVDAADLLLWFDAAYAPSLKAQSNAVSLWSDRSGHGNNLVQGTNAMRPLRVASSVNDLPILRFDGDDDFLLGPDLVDPTEYDLFVVWRSSVAIGTEFSTIFSNGVVEGCNVQLAYSHNVEAAQHSAVSSFGGNYVVAAFAEPVLDTPTLWNVGFAAGSNLIAFTNGAQTTSAAASGTLDTASERLALAGSDQGEYNFTGDIAEVLLFDRYLEPAERDLVAEYLATKWGLTLSD